MNPLAENFSGNWRDYIELQGYDYHQQQLMESTLDQMSRDVPEFCELLCSSQHEYLTHPDGVAHPNQKVIVKTGADVIDVPEIGKFTVEPDKLGYANKTNRFVHIDPEKLGRHFYPDPSGETHWVSLQRVIFHEFVHISDPQVTKTVQEIQHQEDSWRQELSDKYKINHPAMKALSFIFPVQELIEDFLVKPELKKKMNSYELPKKVEDFENYTVERTNAVMHRHYGEAFRDGYQGYKLKEPNKDGVLVHTKTNHSESFMALPIVDVFDTKREEMAQELNAEAIAQKEHLDELLEKAKAEMAAVRARSEQQRTEGKSVQTYENDSRLKKYRASGSNSTAGSSDDGQPVLEKEIGNSDLPLVEEVQKNSSILQKYIDAAQENARNGNDQVMELKRKLHQERNERGFER